jgi:uncharacterized protein (TIGR02996 family)
VNPERPFLDAIRERPDDDAPRLVYADWLEENGDPDHARFIRLTVGRAGRRWSPEASALLEQLLPRWLGVFDLPIVRGALGTDESGLSFVRQVRRVRCSHRRFGQWARTVEFTVTFGRGFAERLAVGLWDAMQIAPALLHTHPAQVEPLHLSQYVPDLRTQALLQVDVGESWVGAATFAEVAGHDKLIPVDPPYHYANTPRKRFHIRPGEDVPGFKARVVRAIADAVTAAAVQAGARAGTTDGPRSPGELA